MTVKRIDAGEQSGYEVHVGPKDARKRLFLDRKCGGQADARHAAFDEEERMLAALPPATRRLPALLDRLFGAKKGTT